MEIGPVIRAAVGSGTGRGGRDQSMARVQSAVTARPNSCLTWLTPVISQRSSPLEPTLLPAGVWNIPLRLCYCISARTESVYFRLCVPRVRSWSLEAQGAAAAAAAEPAISAAGGCISEVEVADLLPVLPLRHSYSEPSLTTSASTASMPICRICHMPSDERAELISPCRCAGTMQYIHTGCLMVSTEYCISPSSASPTVSLSPPHSGLHLPWDCIYFQITPQFHISSFPQLPCLAA